MKIHTEHRNVVGTGMRGNKEFTVKVGPRIMQILSGLYTNPVDAIVREYLTNMYDAVVALKAPARAAACFRPMRTQAIKELWVKVAGLGKVAPL